MRYCLRNFLTLLVGLLVYRSVLRLYWYENVSLIAIFAFFVASIANMSEGRVLQFFSF